ncbi:MAG: hypothetical protein WCM76_08475 [Bacteroidota bacterium]
MDITEALGTDSSRATIDWVVNEIGSDRKKFRIALEHCFADIYPIAMRAARAVQISCVVNPQFTNLYIDEILEHLATAKVEGVRRSFAKLFNDNVDLKNFKQLGVLTNTCFNILESPKEGIAVRYYAMQILYKISQIEPDLKPELALIIQLRLDESSGGIKNISQKLLKKLGKEIEKSKGISR